MEINSLSKNSFGRNITQLAELSGLRCVLCDNSLLQKGVVDSFVRRVCGQNASQPSGISISKYLDTMYFQKTSKQEVLSIMENYAQKYPNKSFGEIFELPEVLEHHLKKSHDYFSKNFERNRPLFEFMEKNLKLSPEQKAKLAELHKKAINISIGNRHDSVKRYLIMQNYAGFQNEVGGAAAAKIIEYASRIPLMPGSPDLILCHMAGKTDAHIMQGLLAPVTPVKKKIVPNDGHGFFMCQNCSSAAGVVPFKSLFSLFPNMFKNLQAQFDLVISALAKGHLRGHGDYPVVVQRLVSQATDGEKVLSLNRYLSQRRRIIQKSSLPLSPQELELKSQNKRKNFENMLLRETPETVKNYLILAEKQKRELTAKGASQEQMAANAQYITLLRKVYISLLRRDKLI